MPKTTRKRRTIRTANRVVARQIKWVREHRRGEKSQQWLADKLGETQSTVTRIEGGERQITVTELFRIAAALDCAPIHLLAAGFEEQSTPIKSGVSLSPADMRAWIIGEKSLEPKASRNHPSFRASTRAYFLENISTARAREIYEAFQNYDRLKMVRELVDLTLAGKAELVDQDPHVLRAQLDELLAAREREEEK
jgi:transcriptional regulator with XRE-family HTH domain